MKVQLLPAPYGVIYSEQNYREIWLMVLGLFNDALGY